MLAEERMESLLQLPIEHQPHICYNKNAAVNTAVAQLVGKPRIPLFYQPHNRTVIFSLLLRQQEGIVFTIKKSIIIDAPVEKVFGYMEDPTHLLEFWPSMIDITNVRQNSIGGTTYEWMYKMAGMKFHGESDTLELIKNKKIITESTKGIPNRFDFDYIDLGDKTEVKVQADYSVPVPLLSKVAEGIVSKLNEHEAEVMLANLKARMEG